IDSRLRPLRPQKFKERALNYIMQDFIQPMGVATYKTADEMEPDILKYLPPKEELIKLIDNNKGED
ncbi:MAG: hypothetical protein ACI4AK_06545, partial [Lepagella sp.]